MVFAWTLEFLNGNEPWYLIAAIALFIVGLVAIIKGGDFFVDAAVWMADVLNMPKFLIGATVVSLATTLPELLVSIFAVAQGNNTMAIGNAVGSVTANTGLILALSAIFVSGRVQKKEFGVKSLFILVTGVILLVAGLIPNANGEHIFGLIPSIVLAVILVAYVIVTIKFAKMDAENNKEEKVEVVEKVKPTKKVIIINIIKFVVGAAGIVIGAQLLVNNATVIAHELHVSDGIIAITIVAIGTSLPELVTTVTSIVKKQGELGVGNVIGANIIDLVLILPICSFISGGNLIVNSQAYILDLPALLIITLIAVVPAIITGKFHKWQGFTMLGLYITYVVLAAVFFVA